MNQPLEAYPLCWPAGRKRKAYPTASRFGRETSFARARDTLLHEVQLLGGKKVILSTNIPLTRDGVPYANRAQPQDKGVAVYFQYRQKPMVFACDEWNKIEHNIWAIAKTIEALRGIERWGSGDMLERAFTGFTALPNPETKKHWREVFGYMGRENVTLSELKDQRDNLAVHFHPDLGGSHERMAELNRAYDEALKELR